MRFYLLTQYPLYLTECGSLAADELWHFLLHKNSKIVDSAAEVSQMQARYCYLQYVYTINIEETRKDIMSSSIVDQYMDECLELGITSRVDICERAKQRRAEIDAQLKEAEKLRQEKVDLLEVLKALGDEGIKRNRYVGDMPDINLDENSQESKEIRQKICLALEENGPMTNRELINEIASHQEDYKVIRNLKYLAGKEVIQRDNERKIVPGTNWKERENV